jgi:hypothetical protein
MEQYFVLTIDVDPPLSDMPPSKVKEGLDSLLSLLDRYVIKATFFVPSSVAERFPDTMREIVDCRHEIACHGLKHDMWETTLDVEKQAQMINEATDTIQSIIGLRPIGFRAPLFLANEKCWKALQKNGYVYDSSVVCSPLYNSHRIFLPQKPFCLPLPKTRNGCGLIEIPVSSNPLLPFPLGGAPMRVLGSEWCKAGIKMNFVFKTPVVFYIHPKDVVSRIYGRKWTFRRWILYRNTLNGLKMLDEILEYGKRSGAKFLKACELARLLEVSLQTNTEYN